MPGAGQTFGWVRAARKEPGAAGAGGGGSGRPPAGPAPVATPRLASGVPAAESCHPPLLSANSSFLPCKLRVSKQRGWLAPGAGFRAGAGVASLVVTFRIAGVTVSV